MGVIQGLVCYIRSLVLQDFYIKETFQICIKVLNMPHNSEFSMYSEIQRAEKKPVFFIIILVNNNLALTQCRFCLEWATTVNLLLPENSQQK